MKFVSLLLAAMWLPAATFENGTLAPVTVEGRQGFLITPNGRSMHQWVWYAPTLTGRYPNARAHWIFERLLKEGISVAGIDVGESYGNPEGRAAFSAFHRHLTRTFGLAPKPCLLAQSRGGLMLYNWAVEHPERIACVAGIYPVVDMASWPGLDSPGLRQAYNMDRKALEAHAAEMNPIARMAPLARGGVPILHVHGDADALVPLAPNSAEFVRRYRALGGPAELIVVPGKGHQEIPEFFESEALVKFLLRYTLSGGGTTKPLR